MMTYPNLEIIDKFFQAYGQRDETGLRQAVADDVKWTFPGHNPISGTKTGVAELIAFFDTMGGIMASSNVKVERLVVGANEEYVVECQHIQTSRKDGYNLDQQLCVLWRFENGKIVEGRHFAADQVALDEFFTGLTS